MNMMTFAVCDDEPRMAEELAGRLETCLKESRSGPFRISRFSSGRALLESPGGFDVILLDIQMEEPDGLETARLLRRRGERGLVIFVTVLREQVYDAFDVEACGYLLKPLDGEQFRRTMDRVLGLLEGRGAALADIVYCEVRGRKVYVHRSGGDVLDYYDKLEDLERRVDRRFFKCHRSYLVNLDFVRGCRDGQVLLPGGGGIPVSRLRERDLTQALLRRMREGDF